MFTLLSQSTDTHKALARNKRASVLAIAGSQVYALVTPFSISIFEGAQLVYIMPIVACMQVATLSAIDDLNASYLSKVAYCAYCES